MATYALRLSEAEIARYRGMAAVARASEQELWATAGISPGARVADVGCGPGAITELLADAVGPSGSVVGVDADPEVLSLARDSLSAGGATNVELHEGQADDTGIAPGSVDVVMLRHVLAHNGGAEQRIVDHLASLLRPGGTVYLADVDLTMMRVVPAPDGMADILDRYVQFHRAIGNDPQVGLRLGELLRTAGLDVVDYRGSVGIMEAPAGIRPPPWAARDAMVAAGVATEDDVRRWGKAMQAMDESPRRPTVFSTAFLALGRRPG